MAAEYKRSTRKKLTMEQLQDISLPVSLELGHKLMRVKELLELTPGRIVKLDRLAGEPVDLVINEKIIAKGEVAVIDENFAVRIVTLLSPEERLKLL
jgi:flagellar motor switch protein FliN/FliY